MKNKSKYNNYVAPKTLKKFDAFLENENKLFDNEFGSCKTINL